MNTFVEEITRYTLCSSFLSLYKYLLPSLINLYLFNPFPRYCLQDTCHLWPCQLWVFNPLNDLARPRLSTNLRPEVVLLPHSWYPVPGLIYFICLGICLGVLSCSPTPFKSGLELQQVVLQPCCCWPRLDTFHQRQSHPFPTPDFLAEGHHKYFLSLEACAFILSEPSMAPSSLVFYWLL